MAILLLSSTTGAYSQIKNAQTDTVKILGNCGMCETTIEKTGNVKKVTLVDWDKNTQLANLTYDAKQTTKDEILQRIALAGYDNEKFLAPDDVYNNLHGCCQYDRNLKPMDNATQHPETSHASHDHNSHAATSVSEIKNSAHSTLASLTDKYFALKDALIQADGKLAATAAGNLKEAFSAVKMDDLKTEEHRVWMAAMSRLTDDAKNISTTQNVNKQRLLFASLSKNMYELVKASKPESPVYYNNCPMFNDGKGANWLSKEKGIKNPYYGSAMLTCGKTVETLQ